MFKNITEFSEKYNNFKKSLKKELDNNEGLLFISEFFMTIQFHEILGNELKKLFKENCYDLADKIYASSENFLKSLNENDVSLDEETISQILIDYIEKMIVSEKNNDVFYICTKCNKNYYFLENWFEDKDNPDDDKINFNYEFCVECD